MFTGLIRELGKVKKRTPDTLEILSRLKPKRGASVAVNGVCLTVTKAQAGALAFDVHEETWRRTSLGRLTTGARVNLEPSLKAGDEMGGHIVSGHVDAAGEVREIMKRAGGFVIMTFSLPEALGGLVAVKGSIAVDGVSLTVTEVGEDRFSVALVPHTLKHTTLGAKKPGDPVNLEADMLARYVREALKR
jgi:riboflavin synthase